MSVGQLSFVGDPPMTRRETLAAGIAAMASALLPDRVFAQDGHEDPEQRAIEAAAAAYHRERSVATFLDWTDLLRHHGDFDLARANLRQLEPHREQWGRFRDRIETIYHAVSFKRFRVEWSIGPQRFDEAMGGGQSVVCIAIPHAADGVIVEDVAIDQVKSWSYKTDDLGNQYIEAVRDPNQTLLHAYTATLGIQSYRSRLPDFIDDQLPDEARRYLGRTVSQDGKTSVDPDGPRSQAVVREFGLDQGSLLQRLTALMRWASQHIKWLPPGSENAPIDSESALKYGGGHCFHIASAKAAVARAVGIPTRLARGNSAVQPDQPYPLWHTEPEYYLPGLGWIMPAGGVQHVSRDPWATLNNCVWKYVEANAGSSQGAVLQCLEAIEYNPQPRLAISRQRLLKEWV